MKKSSFIVRKSYSMIAVVVLSFFFSSCSFMEDVMQGMAQGIGTYPMYGYGLSSGYNASFPSYATIATVPTSSYTSSSSFASSGTSSYSSASSGTSSYTRSASSSSSSSGKMCRLCAGTGDCKTCEGKGFFYNPYDLTKKVLCPNCSNHNGKCSSCGGTGYK